VSLRGRTDAAKYLLRRGADPNACQDGPAGYPTAFVAAIAQGTVKIARLLIRHGARLKCDCMWMSPLGYAAFRGDAAMMRVVLELGADPNELVCISAKWDVAPVMIAIAETHTSCVELLLRSGANANVVCHDLASGFDYKAVRSDWHKHRGKGPPCTPLVLAEATCNNAAVKMLRKFGASSPLPANTGKGNVTFRAPIGLRACALDSLPQVIRLIRGRARLEAIRRLLMRVRNLDEGDGKLLATACLARRSDVVGHLLALGADPNCITYRSLPELDGGSTAIARMLLKHGYDDTNRKGGGPFLAAICCGHIRLVRLLLARGADLNTTRLPEWQEHELTPLMTAIFHGQLHCAALLLMKGADPNLGCGGFPRPENISILQSVLSRRGWCSIFPIDIPYELGDPCTSVAMPLNVAMLTGDNEAVALLLKHGADRRELIV
jgi:ankyrin repeat protein